MPRRGRAEQCQKEGVGDYSAMCFWRGQGSGLQYPYIFGKKEVKTLPVRETEKDDNLGVAEVRCRDSARVPGTFFADYRQISTFKVPIEAEACVFSDQQGKNLPPGGRWQGLFFLCCRSIHFREPYRRHRIQRWARGYGSLS